MGPKKKKGRGKRKKGQDTEPALPEIDKAFYELQITDLNRKLARLRTSQTETENKFIESQKALKQLDEDRADIIAYLERTVISKTSEIETLQAKILKMEKSHDDEIQIYKDQVEQVKREYKVMRQDLTSKIKLLTGKLNSLEEFREQRNELMAKFEQQEEQLREQEERHKEKLYEMERKFIVDKDLLKKELEYRLLQLANDFQKNTRQKIAATTHRVVHENIALNNEFDKIFDSLKILENKNIKLTAFNKKLEAAYDLCNRNTNIAVEKVQLQDYLMKRLAIQHENMSDKLRIYTNIEKKLEDKQDELYNIKKTLEQEIAKENKLLKTIYIYKNEKHNLETELSKQHSETERMRDIIYNASMTIHKILEQKVITKSPSFLKKILKILNRVDEEAPDRITSLSTISSADIIEDFAIVLPKVKPYKYIRNVQNKAVSVTSSLVTMPPISRKVDEEMMEETEMSAETIEEIQQNSSTSSVSSSLFMADFSISMSLASDNKSDAIDEIGGESLSEQFLKSEEIEQFEEDQFKLVFEQKSGSNVSFEEMDENERENH